MFLLAGGIVLITISASLAVQLIGDHGRKRVAQAEAAGRPVAQSPWIQMLVGMIVVAAIALAFFLIALEFQTTRDSADPALKGVRFCTRRHPC